MKEKIIEGILTLGLAALVINAGYNLFGNKKLNYYNEIGSKVVKLYGNGSGGTGFHVQAPSGKTFILTNAHVCGLHNDHFIEVRYGDNRPVNRRIVEIYDSHDLCLVEGYNDVEGIELASTVNSGQSTYLVGHPFLKPLTVTSGSLIAETEIRVYDCSIFPYVVSYSASSPADGASGCIKERTAFNITNYSRPGNSGSPLVNRDGELVGVLFAGNLYDPNDSYAVPLEDVKRFLSVY